MELPPADQILASAIHYLIQGDEQDAALLLLFCDAEYAQGWSGNTFALNLTGPRQVYDVLEVNGWEGSYPSERRRIVQQALEAVAPHHLNFGGFAVRAQLIDNLDPNWRAESTEIAHGRAIGR